MKESRSASQILFGFLPEQTVDLGGRVWKVKQWRNPVMKHVDQTSLRREVLKAAAPWISEGTDNGYGEAMRQNRDLYAFALDRNHGVDVEEFPKVWLCKGGCKRVYFSDRPKSCKCGSDRFGQLPFVGFHRCGAIKEPWVPSCPIHHDIAVQLPETASALDIVFKCPAVGCGRVLRRGFGFVPCACGGAQFPDDKNLKFTVHRASPVFTAQSVVIVNPPTAERVKRLNDAGGAARALDWALDGFDMRGVQAATLTVDLLVKQLMSSGISEVTARKMAQAGADSGELGAGATAIALPEVALSEASSEAVTVALAVDQSRESALGILARVDDADHDRKRVYAELYPKALLAGGLADIDLIQKFPVLTGHFGYTRGGGIPGSATLQPFQRDRKFVVYSDIAETEALFVRLRPTVVAEWLERRGARLEAFSDDRSSSLAILSAAEIPNRGEDRNEPSVGVDVLTLVHSYAHRLIRRVSLLAGIDRNALSELIVPHHFGFFVYAAARGDFVLGGLQAVFESELHQLMQDVVGSDHRCPLDPGCNRVGAACVACMHLGEPSCRYFNRFLSREVLFGQKGYLRPVRAGETS